jgi:WD40 repeat protein
LKGASQEVRISDRDGKELHVFPGHKDGAMLEVAFSPSGRRVLSQTWFPERSIVWETDTGKILWQSDPNKDRGAGNPFRQRTTTVSPDGRFLALPDGSDVKVVTFDDLAERCSVGEAESTHFSPDGKRLVSLHRAARVASGGARGESKLWDLESGREVRSQACALGSVTFSPDGRRYLTSSDTESDVTVFDAATGEKRFTMTGERFGLRHHAFSRDGKLLVTTGSVLGPIGRRAPVVWDVEEGKELYRLEGHSGSVSAFAFSPDGRRIASAVMRGKNAEVKLWDAATGREVLGLKAEHNRTLLALSLAFSQDGHRLTLWANGQTIATWDATPRQ